MATRKYNSSRKIGGHNWEHRYGVVHITGTDEKWLCPAPSYGSYRVGGGDVICLWCMWIAERDRLTLTANNLYVADLATAALARTI